MSDDREIKRGEIYKIHIDYEPEGGQQEGKYRDGIILQNNLANAKLDSTVIAFLTGDNNPDDYQKYNESEVPISKDGTGLDKDSIILLNQIMVVSQKYHIGKFRGEAPEYVMKAVETGLRNFFKLDSQDN